MPNYTIRNKKTGKSKIETMTISEMEQFEKDNPQEEVMCGTPLIHSGRGMGKPPDSFRDILRNVKKKHRRSTVNTF